jgi:hypothetical protein
MASASNANPLYDTYAWTLSPNGTLYVLNPAMGRQPARVIRLGRAMACTHRSKHQLATGPLVPALVFKVEKHEQQASSSADAMQSPSLPTVHYILRGAGGQVHHVHRQLARFQVARGSDGGVQHLAQPGTQQREQTGQVDEDFPHQPSPSCRREPQPVQQFPQLCPPLTRARVQRCWISPPCILSTTNGVWRRAGQNTRSQRSRCIFGSCQSHQFPTTGGGIAR